MKEQRKIILTKDKKEMNLNIYNPDNLTPKVIILGVHGFGEFGERYKKVAEYFTTQGAAFYIHDQRGHGLTPGKRGVIDSYDSFLDDIDLVLDTIKEDHQNKPVVIYGHSMGGNIALKYLMTRENRNITSSIISSPWLKLYKDTPLFLVKLLQNVLGRDFTIKAKIGALSHDREHLKEVNQSGLYHNFISTTMARGIMESGLFILNNPTLLTTPTLLMSAELDNVVDLNSIEKLAKLNIDKIEYINWPDMFHELHNELERQKVLTTAWDFIISTSF
ncbi:MAG: alpha/beta fold hydrolase [Firmicutes bacterium]|nr:alpha/beta fold hydrolase [Bacillota bacterium]